MTHPVRQALVAAAWRCPTPSALAATSPVILTYHGVPSASDGGGLCGQVFDGHVQFLRRHFTIVSLAEALADDGPSSRLRVALTFDDGFANHADVVAPILRRYGAPATFFVPTRHATPNRYLWFAHLQMLWRYFPGHGFTFRGEFMDMSPGVRPATMRRLEAELLGLQPHPRALYQAIDEELPRLEDFVDRAVIADRCAGLTTDRLRDLAADPLFTIGAHTGDHPLLTRCAPAEQFRQMAENKAWVERVCQQPCDTIAYPGSDYDGVSLEQARRAGFTAGFSDHRCFGIDPALERQRTGIYYPSAKELGAKVRWSRVISHVRNRRQPRPEPREAVASLGGSHG